ncbi:tyrosine-type recombinase/integrase [Hydrogenophaga atypica]|uniref:Tyrosine-type recombinase/integrase n=1 Tax=Hydrogenophaga atypica TaxID=249409 RepID=A0ABW2QLF1_9BURK
MGVISQLELLALKASDNGRTIALGDGLRGTVRAGADGSISVYVTYRYRLNGSKPREPSIGTWRAKGGKSVGTSLKALRDEAGRIRGMVKAGIDPVEQAQVERQRDAAMADAERLKIEADRQEAILTQQQRLQTLAAQQARLTVEGLFEQWRRLELVKRVDKGNETERSFKRDVFPLIGSMAAADVEKVHVQEVVDTIKARATDKQNMVRTAKKTLADLRQMFGFALDRDYIDADPTARIKKAKIGKDVERDRVLSESELITLFQKLPNSGMADTSQVALLLQVATLARIGEVLGARWEHIDFARRTWTLPETKNGKRHEIWLSEFAMRQLKKLKAITGLTPWLFPATRAKKDQPDFANHVCEKTVTKQVGDRQRPGGTPMSGRSKHIEALVLSGGKWTPHDLRRTGATMMAELGALPDVVERCLNHTEEKKVKRIYQRAQFEAPMRDAWTLLGAHLDTLNATVAGLARDQATPRTT